MSTKGGITPSESENTKQLAELLSKCKSKTHTFMVADDTAGFRIWFEEGELKSESVTLEEMYKYDNTRTNNTN